jgi:hypothetical protein
MKLPGRPNSSDKARCDKLWKINRRLIQLDSLGVNVTNAAAILRPPDGKMNPDTPETLDVLLARYVAGGQPMGKAGAYAIQGEAERFVKHLSGSYSGVMGLPLFETSQLLKSFGVI